jgi:hypothetical protein
MNDEIHFSIEQYRWLRNRFPLVTWGAKADHNDMVFYNGQQSVLQDIRSRTYGLSAIQGIPEE